MGSIGSMGSMGCMRVKNAEGRRKDFEEKELEKKRKKEERRGDRREEKRSRNEGGGGASSADPTLGGVVPDAQMEVPDEVMNISQVSRLVGILGK